MIIAPSSNELQESAEVDVATYTTILQKNLISNVAIKMIFKAKRENCEVKELSFKPDRLKLAYTIDG